MRNVLKSRGRHRSPLYLATIVALLGAGAADAAPVASGKDGLMMFPNVNVVSAPAPTAHPEAVTGPQSAAPAPGLRAFIDPATGQLVQEPTQAQIDELNAAQSARVGAQALDQPVVFTTPSGAHGARLGESQMVFSVVQKQESGELTEFCVVGPEQATKMLYLKAPSLTALQRKGNRDDR